MQRKSRAQPVDFKRLAASGRAGTSIAESSADGAHMRVKAQRDSNQLLSMTPVE
jgi:hypothetical protein